MWELGEEGCHRRSDADLSGGGFGDLVAILQPCFDSPVLSPCLV